MRIYYQKISSHDDVFNEICRLYTNAFPVDERRPIADFSDILDEEKRFSIVAIFCDEKFVGFISFWNFNEFVYVEHLAILPESRGKGLGAKLVGYLKECCSDVPIVLEVEPDADVLTHRRIGFYNRLGLTVRSDVEYIQPAYKSTQNPMKLWLMVGGECSTERLTEFADTIKRQVYLLHW